MAEILETTKRVLKKGISPLLKHSIWLVTNPIQRIRSLFLVCTLGVWLGAYCACWAQEKAPDTNWPKDESVIPGKGDQRKVTEWWVKQYKSRRDLFWSRHAEKKGAVVFLGDSITELWEPRMKNDFKEWNVANCGIGGDNTRVVLYRLKEDVLDLEPSAIVLLIGSNDIGIGNQPEDVCENVAEILRRIKVYNPKLPVLICKILPRGDVDYFRENILKTNQLVDEFLAKEKNPYWYRLDTYSPFATPENLVRPEDTKDLLHPSDKGYDKLVEVVKPALKKLNLPTVTDKCTKKTGVPVVINRGRQYDKSTTLFALAENRRYKHDE